MFFILYNSGAGGDMVSAVIDSTDYKVSEIDVQPVVGSLRQKLKNSIINSYTTNEDCRGLFFSKEGKTSLLKELEQTYRAVTTSHDFSFMRGSNGIKLDTIVIDDSEYKYSKWGMDRCHTIAPEFHPPSNDNEISIRLKRVEFGKSFGDPKIISLKDILEGRLISILQQWIDTPLNTVLYEHWLSNIVTKAPPLK